LRHDIRDSRFEIRGLLGHGGCGVVHEAFDRHSKRLVALKVLVDGATDPAAMARLVREARVVNAINHPNVCPVVASGVLDNGRHYIATELLRGETLRDYLHRRGALSPEEAIEIGVQILSGLDAAHAVGVVHRDVKPENVFVTWMGDQAPACIKLLDFGLCRREGHALDEKTLTIAGCIVGTPGYLAPEQVRGDRTIDPSVDLFAVGLILFEALTGRRALGGGTPIELITHLLSKPIPAVRTYRPEVPLSLDRIIAHATERDTQARYTSAAHFQHELLEARTAFRREGSRSLAAREAARMGGGTEDSDWNVPTRRRAGLDEPSDSDQDAAVTGESPASALAHPTGQVHVAPRTRRWLRHG
jgi:eukaryotic-like serine/threonine-protein kinase